MAATRFPTSQLEKFSDKIENCLSDPQCRSILEFYLDNVIKKDNLLNALKLWILAHEGASFDDDMFDSLDGFHEDPLLTLSESHQKAAYIKSECCRLLTKSDIHKRFITYLIEKHKQ